MKSTLILFQVKSVELKSCYWEVIEMPPMISPRWNALSELINDSLFIFGGWNKLNKIVRTVEK